MHQTPEHAAEPHTEEDSPLWTPALDRRLSIAGIAVLLVVLLAVIPPYISVNRYQRRVAAAISASLGRPVHFNRLTLHVLPLPGLTIENFVVGELPQFGAEPILRANVVEARLRWSSLWRRRIEVSRISLEDPSINLSRRSDGGWNLQSIVVQASQMNSAPTEQASAGDAPRFPYIEATGARINFKDGEYKLPFSLRDAEFALWLPEPGQWRLRLKAQPVRTDTDVNDVGLINVEATVGRAANIAAAPIELTATWKPTPLGEAAKLTVGHDADWRGAVSGSMSLHGTVGEAKLQTDVHVAGLRRAEFVPAEPVDVRVHCEAVTSGLLRSLHDLRCAVPTGDDGTLPAAIEVLQRMTPPVAPGIDMPDSGAVPGILFLRGDVPNILSFDGLAVNASLTGAHAEDGMTWLRLFSRRIPVEATVGGTFGLTASRAADGGDRWSGSLVCDCILPAVPAKTASAKAAPSHWNVVLSHDDAGAQVPTPPDVIAVNAHKSVPPAEGKAPAMVEHVDAAETITGQISRSGYTLVYGSPAAIQQVAQVLPVLQDGLPADAVGSQMAERPWANGGQRWTAASDAVADARPRRRGR